MLSIGKLGAGHSAYYELSVADGAEDYYTGRGEARGWYLGTGADDLDLTGIVDKGDLKHLFRGTHPTTGEQWIKRQEHDRKPRTIRLPDGRVIEGAKPIPTAAFDLTFSAPKSVSVLWGLSAGPVQQDIRDAHETAVRAAFDYIERTACVTRRGKAGHRHLRGDGLIAAAFHHRLSRAGDPQLHTHVLVANATRAEGRYTALHGALLYREAKTASYLYHAQLRAELTRKLGVAWNLEPGAPHPEIVGVDRRLRDTFSKRSEEIQAQLDATGQSSKRAANAAAIDTRSAKTYLENGVDLHERWITEARGIDGPDFLDAIGKVPARPVVLSGTRQIIEHTSDLAFAPTGLTSHKTTFHRRDVIQLACEQAPQGASVSQIERLADAILDHAADRIVQLRSPSTPVAEGFAVRADGVRLTDHRADTAYTTVELLDHELAIIHTAHARADERAAQLDPKHVERHLDTRPANRTLADEQRRMVLALTTSGSGIEAVVGLAGAGKTFSLDAAHDAWHAAGIEVRGTATALTAAKTLEAETRIPSETIAMLRTWHKHALETGDTLKLDQAIPERGVLIVDEAGMTETRDLSFLTKITRQRNTKLVLVGDHHQLPEIGAGGAFGHLVHNLETDRVSTLATNRRQAASWERAALSELRAGTIEHAIGTYAQHDRIVTNPSPDELRHQLVRDWLNARASGRQIAMIAYTNTDVEALNHIARHELDQQGRLGTKRITIAGREWATGDELIATRNHRKLNVTNGTRGTVLQVHATGLEIRTSTGQHIFLPRDYLERGDATHAYATTGHKTQGMTINGEAFVLASDHINREWLYVAMSRATDQSRIYVDTLDRDPHTNATRSQEQQRDAAIFDLYDLALRSDAQRLARDHGKPTDPQRLDRNDLRRIVERSGTIRDQSPSLDRSRGIGRQW